MCLMTDCEAALSGIAAFLVRVFAFDQINDLAEFVKRDLLFLDKRRDSIFIGIVEIVADQACKRFFAEILLPGNRIVAV